MGWATLHTAPRDREIWLFLPSARWKSDEHGRPKEVEHEVVVGYWDNKRKVWCVKITNAIVRDVYPSSWSDAPIDGPSPTEPELT